MDWGTGRYERIAAQLLPAAEVLIAAAAPAPGERVVDIGCGTGSATLLAAQAGALATGVDPSTRLLEVAGAVAERQELATAEFRSGDASCLPLPDASADLTLSAFGVIFAPDPEEAAAEISRVLRTPGRLVLSAWLPGGPLAAVMGARAQALAAVGAEGPPQSLAWHDAAVLGDLFSPLGFSVESERHELVFLDDSPGAFVAAELRDHPAWIAAYGTLEPHGAMDALTERAVAILTEANEDPGAFKITSEYVIAVLRR
jgi:SAM-dependent methyltransferase